MKDELLVSTSKKSVESSVIVSKSGSKEVNTKIASFISVMRTAFLSMLLIHRACMHDKREH